MSELNVINVTFLDSFIEYFELSSVNRLKKNLYPMGILAVGMHSGAGALLLGRGAANLHNNMTSSSLLH